MTEKCEFCEEIQKQSLQPSNKEKPKLTTTGKWLLGISGVAFTGVFAVTTPFILPALRKICLPYVPATTNQVQNVMKLLGKNSKSMVDLGSGDGRIVMEAAKQGITAHGVELNPWLVWYSRITALRNGVYSNTKFYRKDLFKTDFKKYDNIVVFGVDSLMKSLETSLVNSTRPDCSVIVCRFPFPNWTPVKTVGEGIDAVWLYKPDITKHLQNTNNKT